jgi:hypothetical protein
MGFFLSWRFRFTDLLDEEQPPDEQPHADGLAAIALQRLVLLACLRHERLTLKRGLHQPL